MTSVSRLNTIMDWVVFGYITILNLVFVFAAWTLWIWRDGLLTPEETADIMIGPLLTIGPLAFLIDLLIGALVLRSLRRTNEGDSSISTNE